MKVFVLVVMFLVGIVQLNGQSSDVLEVTLKVTKKKACFGDSIGASMSIKNITSVPVVIDTTRQSSRLQFSWSKENKDGSGKVAFFGGFIFSLPYTPQFKVLQPNETYTTIRAPMVLKDEFFKESREFLLVGTYRQVSVAQYDGIDVWRGWIDSKKLRLRVEQCE